MSTLPPRPSRIAERLYRAAHTLALNPVSHPLYMQGQIVGTHLNSALVGLGVEVVAIVTCVASIGRAPIPVRLERRARRRTAP